MPKHKEGKGTKVTLTDAKKAIRMTPDGRCRLTLSNMGLTVFPKCLVKLTDIDELDLSRNLLQKLPDCIGTFLSLRWLDLHSNKLECLPESIGCLVGLTHLNVSNNRLTSAGIPSSLGFLTSLISLNLGMNQLDNLPSSMVALDRLQELGLFDNLFVTLPDFLKNLPNLTKVNKKRNPLPYDQGESRIESTPAEDMYLVHESSLCMPCLQRCKDQTGKHIKGEDGEEKCEQKAVKTYPGLFKPNSVAAVSQDVWRVRKEEQEPVSSESC